MVVKDLKKVKDEEITLEDVRRAEEIIARANKLLGKNTNHTCNHWHGWSYYYPNAVYCGTSTTLTSTNGDFTMTSSGTSGTNAVNLLNTTLTSAVNAIQQL